MNKDERNEKKQKKEQQKKRKTTKNTQTPNQRESEKGAGQLVVHLSLSVLFFFNGGG